MPAIFVAVIIVSRSRMATCRAGAGTVGSEIRAEEAIEIVCCRTLLLPLLPLRFGRRLDQDDVCRAPLDGRLDGAVVSEAAGG